MYNLKKINKRLFIVDQNQAVVYTPPDFIYYRRGFNARAEINKLVDLFNTNDDIFGIILDFERKY